MSVIFQDTPSIASWELRDPCPGHTVGKPGIIFRNLINTIIISQCSLASPCDFPMDYGEQGVWDDEFDFIIVGGGTAGSVLINRLSEIRAWRILLIEAGGDPTMTSDVPMFYMSQQMTCADWKFVTEKEEGIYNGMNDNQNRWPQGKVLGGSSVLGRMIYYRGTKEDYDTWAKMGNNGWSFADVLPYFKRAENMKNRDVMSDSETTSFHGGGGFLSIDKFRSKEPVVQLLMDAAVELGLDIIDDPIGFEKTGYLRSHGNIKDGERMSTAKAYQIPIRKRQNAYVLKYSLVTKILIDEKTQKAYGVEVQFRNENKTRKIKAKKEVIVSAGTVNTPKLLMLSGIGPENHLKELGIPVIANLRVGCNLLDHPTFLGATVTFNWTLSDTNDPLGLDATYEYLSRRSGRFATIEESEVLGFLSTPENESEFPNLMIFHYLLNRNNTNELAIWAKAMNLKPDTVHAYLKLLNTYDLLLVQPVLLKPYSGGRIRLRSKNPLDPPLIYPGHFKDSRDVEVMMDAIHYIQKMSLSTALRKNFAELKQLELTDCIDEIFNSDQYWVCLLSQVSGTFHNHVGTARMGPKNDTRSVVSSDLKVHGIDGLRVIDASIMPTIPGGPTLGPTVMIAEKGSDIIINYWLRHQTSTNSSQKCETTTEPMTKKTENKKGPKRYHQRQFRDVSKEWQNLKRNLLDTNFLRQKG